MTRVRRIPGTYDADTKLPLLPWVPNTELRRTLTENGMPPKDATDAMLNGPLRLFATAFYFDVIETNKGNKEAKERVDYCREIWSEQAKKEREKLL